MGSYNDLLFIFLFLKDANKLCKIIKKHSRAAIAILVHQEDKVPWKVMRDSMVPLISTPNKLPTTFPTPPVNNVPPMTADAIASISKPLACSTNPPQEFKQNAKPAKAAKNHLKHIPLTWCVLH